MVRWIFYQNQLDKSVLFLYNEGAIYELHYAVSDPTMKQSTKENKRYAVPRSRISGGQPGWIIFAVGAFLCPVYPVAALAQNTSTHVPTSRVKAPIDHGNGVGSGRSMGKSDASGRVNYDSGILLARNYLATHRIADAINVYRMLQKKYPNDMELHRLIVHYQGVLEIENAESALSGKRYDLAIKLSRELYSEGIDRYRVGLILAKVYLAKGQVGRAAEIYKHLARRYPMDPDLTRQYTHLNADMTLTEAQADLRKGNWQDAMARSIPLYEHGPYRLRAGEIFARSYVAAGSREQAAVVYMALEKDYPDNVSLRAAAIWNLLYAYHNDSALRAYNAVPKNDKPTVLHALGGSIAPLYTNYVMLFGGMATSTRGYPNDNRVGIAVNKSFKDGALYLSASKEARFGEHATEISGVYYFGLRDGYSGYVGASFSPENNFLAHYGVVLGLTKSIGSVEIYGSVRQLAFSNIDATVLSGGARYYFRNPLSIGFTTFYVPQTDAYSIMLSPIWNTGEDNKIYMNLSAGMAGEDLGSNRGILKTPSATIVLGDSIRLDAHISVGGEVFHEYRKALYNRSGGLAFVRYWW